MDLTKTNILKWLESNVKESIHLDKVCVKSNQESFRNAVNESYGWEISGMVITRVVVKTNIEDVESFFANFDFSGTHHTPYGCFTSHWMRKFVGNFIECAKTNQNTHYRTGAMNSLMKLRGFLSTKMEV